MVKLSGLTIIASKTQRLALNEICILYDRCRQKDFFKEMSAFLTSGDVLIFIVEGEDAINLLNETVGDTDPHKATKNTIRGRFGESIMKNICHSSMDYESFKKEVKIFFTEKELKHLKIIT